MKVANYESRIKLIIDLIFNPKKVSYNLGLWITDCKINNEKEFKDKLRCYEKEKTTTCLDVAFGITPEFLKIMEKSTAAHEEATKDMTVKEQFDYLDNIFSNKDSERT